MQYVRLTATISQSGSLSINSTEWRVIYEDFKSNYQLNYRWYACIFYIQNFVLYIEFLFLKLYLYLLFYFQFPLEGLWYKDGDHMVWTWQRFVFRIMMETTWSDMHNKWFGLHSDEEAVPCFVFTFSMYVRQWALVINRIHTHLFVSLVVNISFFFFSSVVCSVVNANICIYEHPIDGWEKTDAFVWCLIMCY